MRIFVLDGHPDPSHSRLCHALAAAYADGARDAGHEVQSLCVADMELPLLRSEGAFQESTPPPAAIQAQEAIGWAEHWVLVYPLWLGTMPAALKALLRQDAGYSVHVGGLSSRRIVSLYRVVRLMLRAWQTLCQTLSVSSLMDFVIAYCSALRRLER